MLHQVLEDAKECIDYEISLARNEMDKNWFLISNFRKVYELFKKKQQRIF